MHRVSTALSFAAAAEPRLLAAEQKLLDKASALVSHAKHSHGASMTRHNTYEPAGANTHRRLGELVRAGSNEGGGGMAAVADEPTDEVVGWTRVKIVSKLTVALRWKRKEDAPSVEGEGHDQRKEDAPSVEGEGHDHAEVSATKESSPRNRKPFKLLKQSALEAAAKHFGSLVIFRC